MGRDLEKPQRQKSWVSLIQHSQFDTIFLSASQLSSSLKLLKLHLSAHCGQSSATGKQQLQRMWSLTQELSPPTSDLVHHFSTGAVFTQRGATLPGLSIFL